MNKPLDDCKVGDEVIILIWDVTCKTNEYKDVEGKLIYEGDIVQYKRGLPDPVTGLLEVVICAIEWRKGGFYIPTFDFNLKVIGNIYETIQE